MNNTFEQGWAARPFKEQFPELDDEQAKWLDRLNFSITDLLLSDQLTDSQVRAIREKKFPKVVGKAVREARAAIAKTEGEAQ